MDTIQDALAVLEKDQINNISLINFVRNYPVISIDIIGDSVFARGESDRPWIYISCRDKVELLLIKNKLNQDDKNFAVIDDWMMPVLTESKKINWDLFMIQYYLPENIHPQPPGYKSVPLTSRDADIVYSNSEYKDYISIEYILDRINKGISAGLYENNNLVSWAITQDDGAIGFLHTVDNYRRKGYAKNVMLSMIEKLRGKGELPFAFTDVNNTKTGDLLIELGFKENKRIHWFQIK